MGKNGTGRLDREPDDLQFLRTVFAVDAVITITAGSIVVMPYFFWENMAVFIAFTIVVTLGVVLGSVGYAVCLCRRPRTLWLLKQRDAYNRNCWRCDRVIEKFQFHSYRLGKCVVGESLLPYFLFVVGYAITTAVLLAMGGWVLFLYYSGQVSLKIKLINQTTVINLLTEAPVNDVVCFMLVTWMVALHSLVTISYSIYEIVLLVIYINRLLKARQREDNNPRLHFVQEPKATSQRMIQVELQSQLPKQFLKIPCGHLMVNTTTESFQNSTRVPQETKEPPEDAREEEVKESVASEQMKQELKRKITQHSSEPMRRSLRDVYQQQYSCLSIKRPVTEHYHEQRPLPPTPVVYYPPSIRPPDL